MVTIERLTTYSAEDAASIGELLPSLSSKFTDNPVDETLLKEIIDSPHHDQIVARIDGKIVGTATLSVTIGTGAGHKAYLEDFVVSPDTQGQGVGGLIWDEVTKWCTERNLPLFFTSSAKKEAAHRFYLNRGATIRDTSVFQWKSEK
jgi:GNAT superfamily N-acetyltransferase